MSDSRISRRTLLAGAAAAAGGALLAGVPVGAQQQQGVPAAPPAPVDPTKMAGMPTRAVGARSPFEHLERTPVGEQVGNSLTPLHLLNGTITPADLHFERHHAGVPNIDPSRHELLIHGLVDRPLVFRMEDLRRYPSVTRVHFIECSGNGRGAYRAPKPDMTAQQVDGLTANTEWTGVPLKLLFRDAGVKSGAEWFLAEGGDASLMARSIPVSKALDDALLVWGQNGEPLRPENGYPLRLLVPGFEGNMNVKWLRRIKLAKQPFMTRWETAKYTDPLPNGTARMFSFVMDAKSIITSPSHTQTLPEKGWYPITGLAWTGRGRIDRVDVSTDGGASWNAAELQGPVLPRAHTRFTYMWNWDGREAVIMSRAVDETGYVQPTYRVLRKVRGAGTDFHFNPIRAWRVKSDGSVLFEVDT